MPIMMWGDSGSRLMPSFWVAGFYDDEWHSYAPWHDARGDCLSDWGWWPTYWCPLDEFEDPI
jgi:hypothetical protein